MTVKFGKAVETSEEVVDAGNQKKQVSIQQLCAQACIVSRSLCSNVFLTAVVITIARYVWFSACDDAAAKYRHGLCPAFSLVLEPMA